MIDAVGAAVVVVAIDGSGVVEQRRQPDNELAVTSVNVAPIAVGSAVVAAAVVGDDVAGVVVVADGVAVVGVVCVEQ